MRKSVLLASFILAIAIMSACATNSTTSPVEGTLTIPNGLGFGGDEDGILVQFMAVENDSRCAEDVQCVRAGEAFVVLRSTVDGGIPIESRLEIAPQGQASVEIERFTVTVQKLRPDPPPVGGVEQRDYEILVRIQEN